MVYDFSTNADFDSWVLSSKPRTVKQYVDWISEYAEYCMSEIKFEYSWWTIC